MLYSLTRPIARYILSWYYRRISIDGLEHIPDSGPVILAANHPTAFIEPCILACFQKRKLWFLARGNLFKNSIATATLNGLHILPVFRIQDGGYSKLKVNFNTFQACAKALSKGKAIMILAEGRCIHEKRLRPLRKGTGRIALSSLLAHPELEDIPVVPIGVNFTAPEKMRSEVYIRCGEPISTKDFLEPYREHEQKGILEFTRALGKAIDPLVVQIPDVSLDGIGELALTMSRNEQHSTLNYGLGNDAEILNHQLSTAKRIDKIRPHNLLAYGNRLQRHQLKDAAINGDWDTYLHMGFGGWIQFFIASALLLWQLPIRFLGEYIGGVSTRAIEFYSPVRFAAICVALPLYFSLWFIGLNPWCMAYATLALLGTNWAWNRFEAGQRWYHARMAWRQIPQERQILQELRNKALQELKTKI